MNRLLMSIAAAALISLGAAAQESVHSERPMATPTIHPDNTVTFAVKADSTARVLLEANFLPEPAVAAYNPVTQMFEVVEETPMAPGLYTYHFMVDGARVLDPGNTYLLRDIASLENYFIIPGDADDTATLLAVADVPHGTLSQPWYHSAALNRDRRLSVYTPAGYETSTERYPVLYLLHGSGGDENAWVELGRVPQMLDNLIAAGKALPMIVVMPNATIEAGAAPGADERGHVQPTLRYPLDMTGVYEEIFPEIVEYVDSHYRTIADSDHRAISGLSMGGFHAKYISAEYPEMFGYVGLMSAATGSVARAESSVYADETAKLVRQMEGPLRLYWIGIGKDDFLYDANVEMRHELDAIGFPYEYHESAGGHQWLNWRDYINILSRRLFR